jgi:mannose-6-phosphate isomerase
MPIEHASVRVVHKPWGVSDLRPWSSIDGTADAVGELWFERADKNAPIPALLLKLLFTGAPLSIQVHPDDTFARAMGMPNGKSEAWYIISAKPDARIGIGLERRVTPQELRASIRNGSIVELVRWRPVEKGDVIFVPAGTIDALGAGIVLAEIQQRSDTTFRLFDYGRNRELHEDNGVAVANAWPHRSANNPTRLTGERTVLVASRYFVLERLDLPEGSSWALLAEAETWILILDGHAAIGLAAASIGQAIFVGGGRTSIEVGVNGLAVLVEYPSPRRTGP